MDEHPQLRRVVGDEELEGDLRDILVGRNSQRFANNECFGV